MYLHYVHYIKDSLNVHYIGKIILVSREGTGTQENIIENSEKN